MNVRSLSTILFVALAATLCSVGRAQAPISDDFTGASTSNQWLFYNGACLTSGSTAVSGSIGQSVGSGYSFPGCVSIASSYYGQNLVGGADGYLGSASAPGTPTAGVPDPVGQGALRFTNGRPGGYSENGAIVSASTFPSGQGIEIQFETVTYGGDSGGAGGDGADGISFYLLDGCMPITGGTVPSGCPTNTAYGSSTFPGIGSWGGSLAYTCSNANPDYDGLVGGYLGLGIDEYGNFLNGTTNTLGETVVGGTSLNGASGDNTASGGGYQPGRIGLRGAGSVAWQALTNAYGTNPDNSSRPYYPASLATSCQIEGGTYSGGLCSGNPTDAMEAVKNTCANGTLFNYRHATSPTNAGSMTLPTSSGGNAGNTAGILDYTAIPNAFSVLSGVQIANESATTRGQATPIVYNLKITQDGLLSLSYSVNGGATQEVIQNQDITTANGPLPSSFRFGFAGSTGGDTNIHEILCFKAQPNSLSSSSAGANQKQSAQIQNGAFAYFAYYDPDNWTGRVTANALGTDSSGNLTISITPTWDASCILTGGSCASTGVSDTVEAPTSRTVLTWNGTTGVPFEWSDLTTAQQTALDSTDSTETANRLNYLRGDRTNEVNSSATCPAASSSLPCFRARSEVLGDVIDSSPTWVGPPSSPYPSTWSDRLYPGATAAENSGTQTYQQFITAEETRENVVYVGANDGLLHGFRSGAYTSSGTFNTTAANDGYEVLAYIPGAAISGAVLTVGTGSTATNLSVVDTIHGTNPTSSNAVTTNLDYSNTQYGHNYTVDATPGTGDLFYEGTWHTWLVGGLGPGGAAIYALDVTNPSAFSEGNASTLVMGEWTAATISCENVASCGQSLGNTYGTPLIRRTHAQNGSGANEWAVMWGNGFGSNSGDAGIFVMTIDPSTGSKTIYYLSTGTAGSGNGIAYVTAADLDGDHTTDYVYAGDLKGNIWRFDLTSSTPSSWSIARCLDATCATTTNAPLFTASSGQPITSQLALASGPTPAGAQTLMVTFGTGEKSPFTNTGAATYESGTQSLYGIWDWALSNWNSHGSSQYAALLPGASGLSSPYTLTPASLQSQTISINSSNGDRDITANATVCWQGTSACSSSSDDQFGWYVNLPGSTTQGTEEIVYNPLLIGDVIVVNSTIPPNSTLLSCNPSTETGYTYAVSALTGGALPSFFPLYNDASAAGVETNATGTAFEVSTGNGNHYLVFQTTAQGAGTTSGTGSSGGGTTTTTTTEECTAGNSNCTGINPPGSSGKRLTWIELR